MNCPVPRRWSLAGIGATTLSLLLAPLTTAQMTSPGILPGESSVLISLKRLNEPEAVPLVASNPATLGSTTQRVPVQFVADTAEQSEAQVLEEGPVHEAFAEPISASVDQGTVVSQEPPQPINETPPDYRPDGENVEWIPGYWTWLEEKNDFVWVSGVWRSIPPGRAWTPGHWAEVDGGYAWISGFWSDVTEQQVEYLPLPPESVEQGPSTAAPSDTHFWIPGCWVWEQQRYNWRPGYWYPGQQGWLWVPDHYVYTPRGAVLVNGYWDYPLQQRGLLYAPVYWNGGYRYGSGYAYTPNRVINTALLLSSLFINNNRGYYYYGSGYGNLNQYRPWYAGGNYSYYSPLYGFYSWQYGRNSNNWKNRFDYDRDRDNFRDGRRGPNDGRVALVGSVDDLQRSFERDRRDDRGDRRDRWDGDFRRLTDNERRDALDRSQKMQEFRNARAEFESRDRNNARAQLSRNDGDRGRGARANAPDDFRPTVFNLEAASGADDLRRQARQKYERFQQEVMRQNVDGSNELRADRRDFNRDRDDANRDFNRPREQFDRDLSRNRDDFNQRFNREQADNVRNNRQQVEESRERQMDQRMNMERQQERNRDQINQMQQQLRSREGDARIENRNRQFNKPVVPRPESNINRQSYNQDAGPTRGNSGGNRGGELRGNSNRGNPAGNRGGEVRGNSNRGNPAGNRGGEARGGSNRGGNQASRGNRGGNSGGNRGNSGGGNKGGGGKR